MAIQKTKILTSGVSGNYWRITKVDISLRRIAEPFPVTFYLSLFVDTTASATNKTPIYRGKAYTFSFTRDQILSGNILALGYVAILAQANTLVPPIFPSLGEDQLFDTDLAGGSSV